jgi:hypothetical protein
MVGSALLLLAVAGSLWAGFANWPMHIAIPPLGVAWTVGYVFFKPGTWVALRRSFGLTVSLWIWNCAVCAGLYLIGIAISA